MVHMQLELVLYFRTLSIISFIVVFPSNFLLILGHGKFFRLQQGSVDRTHTGGAPERTERLRSYRLQIIISNLLNFVIHAQIGVVDPSP